MTVACVMRCCRWTHIGVQQTIVHGQLYLLDNPLLRKPLTMDHVKEN